MRERAKLLGGKMTVWSELDSGTEVELSIPAANAYATADGRQAVVVGGEVREGNWWRKTRRGSHERGGRPIRILTVDDHPVVRQGIAGLVAVHSDMSLVAEASNGREAHPSSRVHTIRTSR